ncbi:MAG: excinuclease ABC subunit UvrA [Bacteroidales bacterium]
MSNLNLKNFIRIEGARVNNLKNISLNIPRNKFVVITGLSGSGKSSLAFDTIYAEGQRRYVESLSSYARQFLDRIAKPDVDKISGIPPAIAISQKTNTRNPRSTIGTTSEVYEYLKLLYARVGKTYSPISGELVKRDNLNSVLNYISKLDDGVAILFYTEINPKQNRDFKEEIVALLKTGYSRLLYNGELARIEEVLESDKELNPENTKLLVDRVRKSDETEISNRIADSIETAFYEGQGQCYLRINDGEKEFDTSFNNKFEADGIIFEEPSVNFFSFNNPYGACQKCEGFGSIIGIDEDLVFPDRSKSIFENAIACWRFDSTLQWKEQLVKNAHKFDFPLHRAIENLTPEEYKLLWEGNDYFEGIDAFFKHLEDHNYKIQNRVFISRFRGKTTCTECHGSRLRKDAQYVKINNKSISDIVLMSVEEALDFFTNLKFDNEYDNQVSYRIVQEITARLKVINDIGLSYLTLNRLSNTLSGGETQRLNIATAIGSSLVGSLYILDEPSVGLHSKDTTKLIKILKHLRDIGNSVIVVEHDPEIIKEADYIIDIGPDAGRLGGSVVFEGKFEQLKDYDTHTALYLTNRKEIEVPEKRRKWRDYIELYGAREHNLKNIDVKIPLKCKVVITGVSGSGKTTLIKKTLYVALKRMMGGISETPGKHTEISGDLKNFSQVELVDQNPIGRSSRSNPATFVKAFDDIRTLFAQQALSKSRAYKPGIFSFNTPGGRCDECEGAGFVYIEMQFMSDIELLCDSCRGKRFKDDVLEVKFHENNISDILKMTINQAVEFFEEHKAKNATINRIIEKLIPLQQVGLGYLMMGQSSSTLSGGEAQRLKLASFLGKGGDSSPTLFFLDEPTTGLHVHDIKRLNEAFRLLIERGHSIVIIEHNLDVIKTADWIIELGPEGGDRGGYITYEGEPMI